MIRLKNNTNKTIYYSVTFGNPYDPDSGKGIIFPDQIDELPPDCYIKIDKIETSRSL